jgi:hypothetical protein
MSSCSRADVSVLFSPTDSPALDETLSTILHKIILPSRLPEKQRRLVFDPERRQYLLENPVVIEVEDYEYSFPTLDVKKGDVPPTRTIFWEALRQMRTDRDWANLSTLLYGLREAGRRWEPDEEAKMIRMASEAGHPFPIIDCARQWLRTGLRLNTPEKTLQTLWGVCMAAVNKGWDDERAWRKAVRWGEMVEELAQEKTHRAIGRGMHRNPVAQALLLFPLAHVVRRFQDGVDHDGALRKRLDLVLLLWRGGNGITLSFSKAAYANRVSGLAVLRDPTQLLLQGSLVLSGLGMAREALALQGKELKRVARIEKNIMSELMSLYDDPAVHADKGRSAFDKTVKALGLHLESPSTQSLQEPSQEGLTRP